MRYWREFWDYLKTRQTTLILYLHVLVFSLVIIQVILSNFMHVSGDGKIGTDAVTFYGTWTHFCVGLTALMVALVFVIATLKVRGPRYYFPYLVGDFSQLRSDFKTLKRLELPEPLPGGLAAVTKGLGLGALILVVGSGATWFGAWWFDLAWAPRVMGVHQFLTTFIEIYIVAHGIMGVIHVFLGRWLQRRR